jgi:hypothetical protein
MVSKVSEVTIYIISSLFIEVIYMIAGVVFKVFAQFDHWANLVNRFPWISNIINLFQVDMQHHCIS